jgi:hypothetical protein
LSLKDYYDIYLYYRFNRMSYKSNYKVKIPM